MSYAGSILNSYGTRRSSGYPATPSTPFADVRIARDKVKNYVGNNLQLYGVRGVGISEVDGIPVVVVNVGDPDSIRGMLPTAMDGVPIVIRQSDSSHAQEYASGGMPADNRRYRRMSDGAVFRIGQQARCKDGPIELVPLGGGPSFTRRQDQMQDFEFFYAPAGDAVTDMFGPLLGTPAVSGLTNQAVDRLADDLGRNVPLQREVGLAAGKAVAIELKPYLVGGVVAIGVVAAGIVYLVLSGNKIEKKD